MTVANFDPNTPAVTITDAALNHFEQKLAASDAKILRLSTETSGCTGYAYVLDMAEAPCDGDTILQPGESITLAVDPVAVDILRGTEIDLETRGVNRVVVFNNPNVVSECGCGESFSVA